VPTGQLAQAVQEAALTVVLWLPLGQAEQVRSAVVEPADATTVPAAQIVLLTQIVAGFPSLSQVSSRH
jgi:hypothetical protein